ncbi:Flp family type IVb pilin [Streptomyces sp. NPDC058221]|uniref:Flp family type IVb pilin n=1 Tax=Streptomyces sp. NPDC058221 TaxID=3346388 RepID=UPI0036E10365
MASWGRIPRPASTRAPRGKEQGQTSVEYVGIGAVVVALILAMLAANRASGIGTAVSGRLCEAVATIGAGDSGDCGKPVKGNGPSPSPSTSRGDGDDPTLTTSSTQNPKDGKDGKDPFEPDSCLLSSDDKKTTTRIQILFLTLSNSEQVVIEQYSDGSVTLSRNVGAAFGVQAGVSASLGKLGKWGGEASVKGGYNWTTEGGSQYRFTSHKKGASHQEDLKQNVADAKKYAKALAKQDECGGNPDPEVQISCSALVSTLKPTKEPKRAPDVDMSKTSTTAEGGVDFGLSHTHKGSKEDDNVANLGISGSLNNDVTVLRSKKGEDAGKITFVYTMTVEGKLQADAAGNVGAGGEGNHMQQVSVTYDAKKYDKEKKENRPHHPEKMELTTSQQGGVSAQAGADVEAVGGAGLTFGIEGSSGSSKNWLHTESASLDLDTDAERTTAENWLRGRGKQPAKGKIPSPRDASQPLDSDAGPVERLIHDKAKLTDLDYDVDKDWWDASMAIGIGVSTGSASFGFQLFGLSVEHEETLQTITGDPQYATEPDETGNRPWVPFTNCTDTKPVKN